MRLDELMVTRGLAMGQNEARALIMAGQVSGGGRLLDKPGLVVGNNLELHVKPQARYVSRAGDKLASVAVALELDFAGKTVLDVGSSTGGFTDYALQNRAAKVFCVDVGTGQLAYKLRQDARVVVMERTDIRIAKLPEQVDMAVMDVSFISLREVLEATAALVRTGGLIVAMVKPQFEASKAVADRYHGVIPVGPERDEILAELREWVSERFEILDEADSGVSGSEGNVERFWLLTAK
ncbi:MAG TPA: TlyA family RNA methyltransferase [Candidatus Saccharimonadia bacterium]|jgi:23S rRNA (cytidine1920-2'-O)/16S rRNA (cytidine1409-2'-O)-methyltransferase